MEENIKEVECNGDIRKTQPKSPKIFKSKAQTEKKQIMNFDGEIVALGNRPLNSVSSGKGGKDP